MTNRVVHYTARRARHCRGTTIEVGDRLYAIKNLESSLYFIWSYVDHDAAEIIAGRVQPSGRADIEANWRSHLGQLIPSSIAADKIKGGLGRP